MDNHKSWDHWTDEQRAEFRAGLRECYNALNALRTAGGLYPVPIPITIQD